jgi:hypothetical protein
MSESRHRRITYDPEGDILYTPSVSRPHLQAINFATSSCFVRREEAPFSFSSSRRKGISAFSFMTYAPFPGDVGGQNARASKIEA